MEPKVTILLKEYNDLLSIKEAMKIEKLNNDEKLKDDLELALLSLEFQTNQRDVVESRYKELIEDFNNLKEKYSQLKKTIRKKPWYKFW